MTFPHPRIIVRYDQDQVKKWLRESSAIFQRVQKFNDRLLNRSYININIILETKRSNMNLNALNGLDLNGAFKIANLVVAGLSVRKRRLDCN